MDAMKQIKDLLRYVGVILFFGLCITILSGTVTTRAAENEVKLNVSDVSITRDGSYRLKVYNLGEGQTVLFRSSNPGVAMVTRTGKVYGLAYGDAVITATVLENGAAVAALQCTVTIGPAAISIKLTKTSLVLQEGKQKLLTTVVLPLNTVETPVFFSADTEIAKVSSAGRVRAISSGITQVYAFLDNGQYALCNVTVLTKEDYTKYREGMSIEEILGEDTESTDPIGDGSGSDENKEGSQDTTTKDNGATTEDHNSGNAADNKTQDPVGDNSDSSAVPNSNAANE